jgi:hypothetical protein
MKQFKNSNKIRAKMQGEATETMNTELDHR